MNQPQQKIVETFTPSASEEDSFSPGVHAALESGAASVASPARALQARLDWELQAMPFFSERYAVLKMLTAFTVACAGTWIFGAMLYMQF